MKNLLGLTILILFANSTAIVNAQDSGLFKGNGIKNTWGGGSTDTSTADAPGPFGFHRGTNSAATADTTGFKFPKLQLPKFQMPKLELPKLFEGRNFPNPIQLTDNEGNGLFSRLPKFELPTRDPNQPNFFQRMNDRTRELFGRTRDGINDTTDQIAGAEKSARGTWDTITKGLNGDIGGSGNRNQPPIQPKFRSARQTDGSTTRF